MAGWSFTLCDCGGGKWQLDRAGCIRRALLRADLHHVLEGAPASAGHGTSRVICTRTRLTGPVAALFLEEFAQARIVVLTHEEPALRSAVAMIEAELDAPRFTATFRDVMKRTSRKYLAAIRLAIAQRAVDLGKGLKEAASGAGYRLDVTTNDSLSSPPAT